MPKRVNASKNETEMTIEVKSDHRHYSKLTAMAETETQDIEERWNVSKEPRPASKRFSKADRPRRGQIETNCIYCHITKIHVCLAKVNTRKPIPQVVE